MDMNDITYVEALIRFNDSEELETVIIKCTDTEDTSSDPEDEDIFYYVRSWDELSVGESNGEDWTLVHISRMW